jgi:hypothetical protein
MSAEPTHTRGPYLKGSDRAGFREPQSEGGDNLGTEQLRRALRLYCNERFGESAGAMKFGDDPVLGSDGDLGAVSNIRRQRNAKKRREEAEARRDKRRKAARERRKRG